MWSFVAGIFVGGAIGVFTITLCLANKLNN